MAIYADKRDGKVTGWWRVELQKGAERYRRRHKDHAAAQDDEKRVLGCWEAGLDPNAPQEAPAAPVLGVTFSQGLTLAEGRLWDGLASESGNYQNLRVIEKAIGGDTLLNDIDTSTVVAIKQALGKRGVSWGTTNRYLSHLKTFLNWQCKNGHRTVPINGIEWEWKKESKGRIRWLTFEEEDALMDLLPENVGHLVKVAIETGCRREELLSLQAHQVDQRGQDDGLLHLWKTKNGDTRSVPISAKTAATLRHLIGGNMPSARTLRRHWDKAKEKMGLAADAEFVFHACRHTCATRMVDADVDILIIKQWLGHKRIETTQRYAHAKPRKLQSILARVGGLRAAETGIPQISAVPHTPPQASPGGENAPLDVAA